MLVPLIATPTSGCAPLATIRRPLGDPDARPPPCTPATAGRRRGRPVGPRPLGRRGTALTTGSRASVPSRRWATPRTRRHPGFWVVSDHEHVTAPGSLPARDVLRRGQRRHRRPGPGDELQAAFDAPNAELAAIGLHDNDAKMLLSLDPPEHTQNRKVLNREFTPGAIGSLEPAVRELAGTLLDAVDRARGDGDDVVDFTTEVAMPPMQVIGDLLGAPRHTHRDLLRWSNEAVTGTDPSTCRRAVPAPGGGRAAGPAVHHHADRGGSPEPTDDLVSGVDRRRDRRRALSQLRFIMPTPAGHGRQRDHPQRHEPRRGAFAEHPEQWDRLREDPSLLSGAVRRGPALGQPAALLPPQRGGGRRGGRAVRPEPATSSASGTSRPTATSRCSTTVHLRHRPLPNHHHGASAAAVRTSAWGPGAARATGPVRVDARALLPHRAGRPARPAARQLPARRQAHLPVRLHS